MPTIEEWRDVEGYEGLYQISSFGRIKSLITNRIMKQSLAKNGYLIVNLSNHGKQKVHTVHRLAANAFIKKIDKKTFVNHKDGNKQNNEAKNLEWCTKSENAVHSLYVLNKRHGAVFTKRIRCVETGEVFPSSTVAANGDATLARYIRASADCRRYYETANGYHWEWVQL